MTENELMEHTITPMMSRIQKLEATTFRDRSFILEMIKRLGGKLGEQITATYAQYCEDFDKANKLNRG